MSTNNIDYYKNRCQELEDENYNLQDQLELMEEKLSLYHKDNELQLDITKEKVNTVQLINKELVGNIHFYENQTQQLNNQLTQKELLIQNLQSQIQQLHQLKNTNNNIDQQLLQQQQQSQQRVNTQESNQNNISSHIQSCNNTILNNDQFQDQLQMQRKKYVNQLEERQEKIEDLERQLKKKNSKNYRLQKQLESYSVFLDSTKHQLEQLTQKNSSALQEIDHSFINHDLANQIESLQKDIQKQQQQQQQNDDTQSQVSYQQFSYNQQYVTDLKQKLNSSEQLLLGQLEVIKELEFSITILQDFIQGSIVKNNFDFEQFDFSDISQKDGVQDLKNVVINLVRLFKNLSSQLQQMEKENSNNNQNNNIQNSVNINNNNNGQQQEQNEAEFQQSISLNAVEDIVILKQKYDALLQMKQQYKQHLGYQIMCYSNISSIISRDKENHDIILQKKTSLSLKKLKVSALQVLFLIRLKKFSKNQQELKYQTIYQYKNDIQTLIHTNNFSSINDQQRLFNFDYLKFQFLYIEKNLQQQRQSQFEQSKQKHELDFYEGENEELRLELVQQNELIEKQSIEIKKQRQEFKQLQLYLQEVNNQQQILLEKNNDHQEQEEQKQNNNNILGNLENASSINNASSDDDDDDDDDSSCSNSESSNNNVQYFNGNGNELDQILLKQQSDQDQQQEQNTQQQQQQFQDFSLGNHMLQQSQDINNDK